MTRALAPAQRLSSRNHPLSIHQTPPNVINGCPGPSPLGTGESTRAEEPRITPEQRRCVIQFLTPTSEKKESLSPQAVRSPSRREGAHGLAGSVPANRRSHTQHRPSPPKTSPAVLHIISPCRRTMVLCRLNPISVAAWFEPNTNRSERRN